MNIRRALISVYDKSGIVDFARKLEKLGIEMIATSGTFKILKEARIESLKKVSSITRFPEILEGRLKTEHPNLMGGILALRENEEHMTELKKLGIDPVDIVVCNLKPFDGSVKSGVNFESALESIDVGGPNMIRAAAKNFKNVIVVVTPYRYNQILREIDQSGDVSAETRRVLAVEAFRETARYESAIYNFLERTLLT
jgi:phosphoribosylaminoimidazolecarboxamide formyltransferase/IMP cyclohydrolase